MLRIPLASLPLHAVDLDGRITLRRGSDDEPEARVVVLGCDADAVRAAAPHLGAVLWLSLCDGPPATTPGPSRDELAARNVELERELTDRVRELTATASALASTSAVLGGLRGHIYEIAGGGSLPLGAALDDTQGTAVAAALRTLAARVDPQPPQRAPGVVAGVAADVVDVAASHLGRALRGAAAAGRRAAGGAR